MAECKRLCSIQAKCQHFHFASPKSTVDWSFEEFFQESIVELMAKLNRYDDKYAFSTFYAMLCKNLYTKHYIKKRNELNPIPLYSVDEDGEEFEIEIPARKTAEEEFYQKEKPSWNIFKRICETIPANYYEAARLVYMKGKSVKETANEMSATICQVNNWLARFRDKTKNIINNNGFYEDLYDEIDR